MKRTINEWDFVNAFDEMYRGNNFSYEGRKVLFEMLTELEESCDEEMELDVIAICCQFSEYTIDELAADYPWAAEALAELDEPNDDEKREAILEALDDIGAFHVWIDGGSLILDVESF